VSAGRSALPPLVTPLFHCNRYFSLIAKLVTTRYKSTVNRRSVTSVWLSPFSRQTLL